ncbi:hypothetical protein R7Q39_27930 [Vibrio sp. 947]|uniref:hypothetical protein n=1 Tax=unclassified Vibrio TaxID=2614977 RepID=UPI002964A694|nr:MULTISPECIES: hypothetical protein [unclassified Vibrio]MDW1584415.1 hypothetical protein [Vibrio sp. Vb2897]MDW1642663.1 hypothetical protein [Vibrio sp. Vb2896]MDW1929215.1 hypothetical protein [Vibrio sp. 947]
MSLSDYLSVMSLEDWVLLFLIALLVVVVAFWLLSSLQYHFRVRGAVLSEMHESESSEEDIQLGANVLPFKRNE